MLPEAPEIERAVTGGSLPAVRAALAAMTGFLIVLAAGRWFVPFAASRQLVDEPRKGDSERLDGLLEHKRSTPTLGGALILLGLLGATAVWAHVGERLVLILLAYTAALGGIGLADDLKKMRTRRKGLSARGKLLAQVAISAAAGFALQAFPLEVSSHGGAGAPSGLYLPLPRAPSLDLGWSFPLFVVLVTTGASNAVNLTDGLDGLAAGSSAMVAAVLAAAALLAGGAASVIGPPRIAGASEIGVFLAALGGSALGFLWFNCHPARIFMGDTGSLAIGGALGLAAVMLKQEVLLALAGGVLVAEALSVILQVLSFKMTGRRIFLIAPIHHHFQFKGWPETRVTVRFWVVGALLALASLALLAASFGSSSQIP